ncbi:sialidase family protein [Nocardia jejuensis]|uniref:sialidase family protein n=1 Tax=Nocardia jejuensis TaxID=328049 RepID=UPI000832DEF0|nr:sialidase family protein [Nocardia jejuensis]
MAILVTAEVIMISIPIALFGPRSEAATRTTREFLPESVSFISPEEGWVLGTVGHGRADEAEGVRLEHTADGGLTWRDVGVVPGYSASAMTVRFSDSRNGWVIDRRPGHSAAPSSSTAYWQTRDGGASWERTDEIPHTTTDILGTTPPGASTAMKVSTTPTGPATSEVDILTSPLSEEDWTSAWTFDTGVDVSGTGNGGIELVRQGESAWVFVNRRFDDPSQPTPGENPLLSDGARLIDGKWSRWTPPCREHMASMDDAVAPGDTELMVFCNRIGSAGEGLVDGEVSMYASHDGGRTFDDLGIVPTYSSRVIGAASPDDIVLSVSRGPKTNPDLLTSNDGGRTWQTSYSPPRARTYEAGQVTFVNSPYGTHGFVSGTLGYVIETTRSDTGPIFYSSRLLMTRDSGRTWAPVEFPL